MSNLVHLHRHGDFSLLDGIGKDEEYANLAKSLNQKALALTDHGTLAGVLYHVEACNAAGIKPIVGMEAYFREDIKKDRENQNRYGYFHLLLLAKNQEGFKNLMRLTSASYTDEYFYQKPCIDWKLLRENSSGIIASSSCVSGLLPNLLLSGDIEGSERILRIFKAIFKDDFYLETQPHDFPEQRKVNLELLNLSLRHSIPVVAAVDAHYPFKDWRDTQDISLMISTGSSLKKRKEDEEAGKDYLRFAGDTFWLMSEDELKESFEKNHPDIPRNFVEEMINNSLLISERCEDFNYDKRPKIPRATETVDEAEKIIRLWCEEGLERIGKVDDRVYRDRMEEELSVMVKLKVLDYFVIVGDMVRWAKSNGIRVGPGRGSAAGSLVNYLIRITAIDPIGYNLLFERFLNEYRTELPDIDIDFQDDRRDEVKEYLAERWGRDHVVDIASFQSFGLKGVIQDVSRVLDIPYVEVMRATKMIPDKTFGDDIESIERRIPEIASFFQKYPEVRKHSIRLFGNIKGLSKHPAAVIVTDEPAHDLIPTMRSKDGSTVTQWSERANAQLISPYGFLKIDCLSTDGLTNQSNIIRLVRDRHGHDIDFEDPNSFPVVKDPRFIEGRVIDAFSDGTNIGIFQFESKGIVGLLKQIKPKNLDHIIAANALYRPGTLENQVAFDYAKRKNNLQRWKIPHESVKKYLDDTFGFMIYQEQVMQIYNALAKDATSSEAATFLKVVAKGIARDLDGKKKLQKYYDKFVEGCKEKGISEKSYELIWSQIIQMSTYSFNKSHSAGYALQAYQDMYLKKTYPLEFYTSLLSVETEKVPQIIRESKAFGIKILQPDINDSGIGFTIKDNLIRFGLLAVKSVGPSAVKEIMEKRPFESYEDFVNKCEKTKVKKQVKENLFYAGAFDRWGGREQWHLSEDGMSRVSGPIDEAEKKEREKEAIGFSLSSKEDILKYKTIIEERITESLEDLDDKDDVIVAGELIDVKIIKTKTGKEMAFAMTNYLNHDYSLTLFPEIYSKYSHMMNNENIIFALGEWDKERETIIVNNICLAEQLYKELNSAS